MFAVTLAWLPPLSSHLNRTQRQGNDVTASSAEVPQLPPTFIEELKVSTSTVVGEQIGLNFDPIRLGSCTSLAVRLAKVLRRLLRYAPACNAPCWGPSTVSAARLRTSCMATEVVACIGCWGRSHMLIWL